jgi:cell division septum initiation protein DivIVA
MSEHELRKADDLLTELVELVETARAVPISGAAMVPREHVLDLLDDLREVLPPEMAEARRIVSTRDGLLAAAHAQADAVTTDSTEAARQRTEHAAAAADARLAAAQETADAQVAAATEHANATVAQARAEAGRLVAEGEAENARLVSSAGVYQAAAVAADQLRAEADAYHASTWAAADHDATQVRSAAEQYAGELRTNAENYVEGTLAEAVDVLRRSASVADRGRSELIARRAAAEHASGLGQQAPPGQAPSEQAPSEPVPSEPVPSDQAQVGQAQVGQAQFGQGPSEQAPSGQTERARADAGSAGWTGLDGNRAGQDHAPQPSELFDIEAEPAQNDSPPEDRGSS